MNLFASLEFYFYTAFASGVAVWASHHPMWHDPALWLLGVIGHAIGVQSASLNGSANGNPGLH